MSNPIWYASGAPDPYYDGGAAQERADASAKLAEFRRTGDWEPPGCGPKEWSSANRHAPRLGTWDAVVHAWWDFLDICEELEQEL